MVKHPLKYHGDVLLREYDYDTVIGNNEKSLPELSGHDLDEIIDESFTNPKFAWSGGKELLTFWASGIDRCRTSCGCGMSIKFDLQKSQLILQTTTQQSSKFQPRLWAQVAGSGTVAL